MSDEDTLRELSTKLTDQRFRVRRYDAYYDGELRLAALGLSLPPEMRALQTVVNWPRVAVDALEARIDVEGFRLRGTDDVDDRLWSWWQANNLDEESSLLTLEAFVQGRAYVTVGYNEDRPDVPLIRCESARNMYADIDPRTQQVRSAVRHYEHNPGGEPEAATLYLPGRTMYWRRDRGRWRVEDVDEHGLAQPPVVPLVNRARLHDRTGRSEMADVIGLTDAACRNLTNLQGAQELMALPTRYVFGIDEADMKTQDGSAVTKWEAYIGRFNTLGSEDAKVVQLPAADLRNFADTMNMYARLVASVTGLPLWALGLSSENPPSADAIRSSEASHVKRAEKKCRAVGGTWEAALRIGMEIVDGSVPEEAYRMETVFADCATPTQAQTTDSVVKLVQSGVLPKQAAWEELGYSAEKRRRLAEMDEENSLSRLVRSLGVNDTPASSPGAAPGEPPAGDAGGLGAV